MEARPLRDKLRWGRRGKGGISIGDLGLQARSFDFAVLRAAPLRMTIGVGRDDRVRDWRVGRDGGERCKEWASVLTGRRGDYSFCGGVATSICRKAADLSSTKQNAV